ncbi:MAG: N-acetyltransferase, partial [Candidatus Bipolaricaulota bacterium]
MEYRLEPLTEDHRSAATAIFNDYVADSFAAYPERPVGDSFFDRVMETSRDYPALAARDDRGLIVGFAFLHPFRSSSTFRATAEISYFIH